MKREVATLPADLPHAYQPRPEDSDEIGCELCDRQVGAQLHQDLVIEKATVLPRLVREKGV